jgi:hypothetical protein
LKIATSTYRRRKTIRPGRQKTATKLTCLENTENIQRKTERETKIKLQRVTILLRTAGVSTRQIWKETLIISCFRLSEKVL